eukprot:CAMPEP_0114331500 /NCGR_PEP_ID=MMETSP0101-20121206/2444_1 /TAXON_ID=38822 ORGANISM="Pteridomonas danica, Strain PT" /NCGR_SAMPLE_ID=MMETSP0101 /ASSEMBLY_ACC=CAM_ASM_000211 /LENGTH=944 /DNA_ID=CAMNT_0001461835 /DNA_START=41 /DNA_END=2876 /DNA_ORIENTATION=-
MNSKIPVSIVPRDESKKPEWYDQWILDSKSNPNYSGAQVESSESIESMSLVQDPLVGNSKHSVMGPAQFGWVWKDNNQKFMKWYDLWAICRDTQSNQKGEKIVIDAITRFGEQGGRDIWGNSFDSSFESTTTIEAPVETDKMLKHPSGTEYMGNQRYRHPNGEHRRSLENGRPRRPTLRHILVGNGYGLIHLLVAKNMPLSLEHLLSQKIVTIDPIQDDDEDEEEEEEEEDDDDSNDDKDKTDKYINEADETREITKKKKKKKEKKAKESVEKLGDGKTNLSGCTSPSDTFASPTNRKTTKERTCTSKLVNVDLVSWGHETALDLARDLRYVQCALVLEKAGAHLDPGPPVSWLDVWRAIADKIDDVAVETVQKFRRQGCKDVDGFDLSYHRMSRPERGDPQYQFLLKQHRIKDEYATRGDDENDKDGDEDKDGDADEDNVDASRLNHGLRGHQWWGYADETLGWTLAHIAAARDKPLCLSELACAGIDLNANATPGLKRDRCTPLSLAIDKGSTRCVSVLINHGVQPVAGGYGVPGGGLQPMSSQHHISSSSQNNNNNGRRRGVGLYNGNDKHCNSSQGQSHNPWFGFRNQAIEPTSILANETSWVKPYPLNIKQEHDETHNENNSINNSSRSNRRSKTQSDNDNIKLINNLARTLREKTNINHKNSKTEADVSDVFDEMWSKSTPRDYQTSQEVRSFEKNSNNNHNNHNNNNNSNNSVDNNELDENMARTSSGWGNNNEHSGWLEDRETHGWETTETKNGDNHDDGIDDGDGGWGDFNQSNDSSKFNQDQNTCIEEKKEVFNSTKDKYINYRKSAICPLDADQVITYEDMWSALASEPEDQAFHKLKLFLLQSFQNTNQAHQKKKHINDKFVIDNNDDSKHNRNDDSDDAVIDESIETCLVFKDLIIMENVVDIRWLIYVLKNNIGIAYNLCLRRCLQNTDT